jgi:hypothetical protein
MFPGRSIIQPLAETRLRETRAVDWRKDPADFSRDVSTLRDINITNCTPADWSSFLLYVRESGLSLQFFQDDVEVPPPACVEEIMAVHADASPLLLIDRGGMNLISHFLADSEIDLDFEPGDFETSEMIERLSDFLAGMGKVLAKPVDVTCEGSPHLVIWRYEPDDDRWIYFPAQAGQEAG